MYLYLHAHRGKGLLYLRGITTHSNTASRWSVLDERRTVQKRQTHFLNCPCHFITNSDENCSKQWHHLKMLENSYITQQIFLDTHWCLVENRDRRQFYRINTHILANKETKISEIMCTVKGREILISHLVLHYAPFLFLALWLIGNIPLICHHMGKTLI